MEEILSFWFPEYGADEKKGILIGKYRVLFEVYGPLDVIFRFDKSERRLKKEVKKLQDECRENKCHIIVSEQCTPPVKENVPNKLYIYTHIDITPISKGRNLAEEEPEAYDELMLHMYEMLPRLMGSFFLKGVEKFPDLLNLEPYKTFKESIDSLVKISRSEIETSNAELSRLYA